MSDTSVDITPGTGASIDTRTEGTNGNHRQVVVLGDPATNAGVAPVDATTGLKVDLGADNDVTVTSGTISTITNVVHVDDNSGSLTVDAASLPLPTGASTSAKQDTGNTSLSSIDGKITAVNTGAVVVSSSALPTGAATAAKQLADNHNVVVTSAPTTAVTGTFWQATQPVSLASVPSHAVTNAGTFAVQATEADGANTTLGAKADAKSTATDTTAVSAMSVLKQISASVQAPPSQAVTNAGTFAVQASIQDGSTSGSLTSTTSVTLSSLNGANTAAVQITGTWVATLQFEGSVDGTNFFSVQAMPFITGAFITSTTANGQWQLNTSGISSIRVRCSAFTSGTAVVNIRTTVGVAPFSATQFIAGGQSGQVQGNQSSGGADSGNPIKVGGRYNSTKPTFTDGQRGDIQLDTKGNQLGVVMDAAGNARGANVNSGNQLSVSVDGWAVGTAATVVDSAVTSGGLSIVTGSVGATATAIKASAGQLYGYHLFNTTAAVAYVQIFNVAAGSVTLGTTAPTISIGLPANGGATVNLDKGIAFGTAISYACTTTRAGSTGATCDVNFFYK